MGPTISAMPGIEDILDQGGYLNRRLADSLREAYDRAAEKREQAIVPPWKMQEREQFLSWLEKDGKRRLLEIGAGTGKDSQFFQAHGMQVVCIDLSPEMVRLCREKGLTAYEMDLMNLDFPVRPYFNSKIAVVARKFLSKRAGMRCGPCK